MPELPAELETAVLYFAGCCNASELRPPGLLTPCKLLRLLVN